MHRTFSEDDLQEQIVSFFRMFVPLETAQLWAIPNGGYRRAQEAIRLKEQGATAGVPDLMIVMAKGRVVWVEVKRPANPFLKQAAGKLSDPQKKIHAFLRGVDHEVHVIDNLSSFHELLKSLGLTSKLQPEKPSYTPS